jgi:acetyltransferase-like isoleucine patch superfamily enzyme
MKVLPVTRALLDLLQARRVYHRIGAGERWAAGQHIGVHPGCAIEPYVNLPTGQVLPRALGAFSYTHSALHPNMTVGRYCSIARGLTYFAEAHPLDWATSSPVTFDAINGPLRFVAAYVADQGREPYQPFSFDEKPRPITVGNDVWIGADALIAGGVTIGDGAVIGARSTVTRDVPPYAIVVGSPAKVVRMRFSETVVERLLELRWWRYGPDVIQRLDPRDIERFLDAAEGLEDEPMNLRPLTFPELEAASRTAAQGNSAG